jgi:hypothetical protein
LPEGYFLQFSEAQAFNKANFKGSLKYAQPSLRKIFSPVFDVCNAGDTFAKKYLKRHAEQTCGCNGTLG